MSKKTIQADNKTAATETIYKAEPQKRLSHRHRIIVGILILVILFIPLSLLVTMYQFGFLSTRVGSISVTNQTNKDALISQLTQASKQYMLSVAYPDGSTKQFSLDQLGITVDAAATAEAALDAQEPKNMLIRAQWWNSSAVPATLQINDQKLDKVIRRSVIKSSQKPQNARIKIKNGKAALRPEKSGQGYALSGGRDDILNAVKNLQTTPITAKQQEIAPAITLAEAGPVFEQVKQILSQKVVFNIDGRAIATPASSIGRWIEITNVESAQTIDLSVNSGKVLQYINTIAKPYVQPPRSAVVLKKSNGSTQLLVAGKSGVDVVRKNTLAASVAKKVLLGKGVTADAPIKYAAYKTINARSYPKWLVVDTAAKRMYAYQNTRLVRTFLISAGAPQTPTVTGQYAIRSKVRVQDMRGNNVDGSRYFQPNVEYVNYFYADYAIHGNYWRPTSYFGNVNSSHGCVGIRNNDAAWVYNWASIGTPVIVHN